MIKVALQNISAFVSAAHEALNSIDKHLLHYFFAASDFPVVSTTFKNVRDRLNHLGAAAIIFCEHADSLTHGCEQLGSFAWTEISVDQSVRESAISLCPAWFQAPDMPDPCSISSLMLDNTRDNKAFILLYELFHIPFIAGPGIWRILNYIRDAKGCNALAHGQLKLSKIPEDLTATNNAANYALLAQWGLVRKSQQQCPTAWAEWNLTDSDDIHPPAPPIEWVHEELRKLLSSDDGKDGINYCGTGQPCDALDRVRQRVAEEDTAQESFTLGGKP